MFSGFRRRSLVRVLLVALTIGTISIAAYATHSWNGYHWARTSNPFTLKLGDNVSALWDLYLQTASNDWSVSDVLDTTIVAGGTTSKRCRPVSGRVEVCADKYGFNGWLGIAQVWLSGQHITQAVTKMNDSYFNTAKYNKPAWRQFVMCQEVGHTFGLDHQDEDFSNPNLGSCMDYTDDPDGTLKNQADNTSPNLHDYQELNTIYAHLDSTTTVGPVASGPGNGQMPPAMSDIDLGGPGQGDQVGQGLPAARLLGLRTGFRRRAQGFHVRHLGEAEPSVGVAKAGRVPNHCRIWGVRFSRPTRKELAVLFLRTKGRLSIPLKNSGTTRTSSAVRALPHDGRLFLEKIRP